jgi:hypothetical protein
VRVVHLPGDVVDADLVAELDAHGVLDEAGQEVAAEDVTRLELAEVLTGPAAVHIVGAIRAVEEVRDPAGATLRERDLELWEAAGNRRPEQVGCGGRDVHRLALDHHVHRGVRSGDDQLARRAEVDRQDGVAVAARLEHRIPVAVVPARAAERYRVLGECHRVTTELGDAADLCGRILGRPDHALGHRDEAIRVRAAPLVDVPVVVGVDERLGEVLVGVGVEQPPAEARHRREAHRAEHARSVHVLDALVDVVAARAHLLEGSRLHAVLLLGTTRHGVQADVRDRVSVEGPHIVAGLGANDLGRLGLPLRRQVLVEHVRRLAEVVVDADEDHVFELHGGSS